MPDATAVVRRAVLLGLSAALAGAAIGILPRVLELDENVGLGALFYFRGPPSEPADSVAIVGISGATFRALDLSNELDEWPRSIHAEVIDRLSEAGAAVIVFDINFAEGRGDANDAALVASIERAGNVLLLERTLSGEGAPQIVYQRRQLPFEAAKRAALGSAPFTLPTVPIRVSQFWVFDRGGSNVPNLPAVALQALDAEPRGAGLARLLGEGGVAEEAQEARIGRGEPGLEHLVQSLRDAFVADPDLAPRLARRLAAEQSGPERSRVLRALLAMYGGPSSGYLNYYGPPGSIETIPFHEVLDWSTAETREARLAGKVVFVGLSESRQSEQVDTFYSVFSQRSGLNLSGVEIGATAFANLLNEELVAPLGMFAHLAVLVCWGLMLGTATMILNVRFMAGCVALALLLYAAVAAYLFSVEHLWVPIVVPLLVQAPLVLLAGFAWRHAVDRAHRDRIRAALGAYVSDTIVSRLDHGDISRDSVAQLVYGTCLLTDVKHYTRIAESLGPEALAHMMNEYYSVLYSVVTRHSGLVSDTAGDSMVAVWTHEHGDAGARAKACRAGLEIRDALARLQSEGARYGLRTGVGLATGELLMGNIGSDTQFDYRAIGSVINTAARIQSLNRRLGSIVLASMETVERVDGLRWRALGEFVLAGKTAAVAIVELLGDGGAETAPGPFAEGIERFRARDWSGAIERFRAVLELAPSDGAARFYRALCESYAECPPGPEWTGAVDLAEK